MAKQARKKSKKVNLSGLSRDDLLALSKDIDKALKATERKAKSDALKEAKAVAKQHGFSLDDLVGGKPAASRKKASVAAKYRHPENSAVTWTGRGRQPKWFKEAVEGGAKPESMLIK